MSKSHLYYEFRVPPVAASGRQAHRIYSNTTPFSASSSAQRHKTGSTTMGLTDLRTASSDIGLQIARQSRGCEFG